MSEQETQAPEQAIKSKSARIREMLDAGTHPKEIALAVGVPVARVYNVRYHYAKQKNPVPVLTEVVGQAEPKKRGRKPKAKETGIAALPVTPLSPLNGSERRPYRTRGNRKPRGVLRRMFDWLFA